MNGLDDLELEELMDRVAYGDGEAFEHVYAAVAGPVYGLVAQVLPDRVQCEKVTQEVLVELWQTSPRYEAAHGSVMTWAMSVAHRRAVDRKRAGRRYDQDASEDGMRIERQKGRHGWDALTETQREAVMLTYYAGHTYRQVAARLNTSHDAIKATLHDALTRLATA
jgi:RNA polymerase sigma-70 factor, ECF subfamily